MRDLESSDNYSRNSHYTVCRPETSHQQILLNNHNGIEVYPQSAVMGWRVDSKSTRTVPGPDTIKWTF